MLFSSLMEPCSHRNAVFQFSYRSMRPPATKFPSFLHRYVRKMDSNMIQSMLIRGRFNSLSSVLLSYQNVKQWFSWKPNNNYYWNPFQNTCISLILINKVIPSGLECSNALQRNSPTYFKVVLIGRCGRVFLFYVVNLRKKLVFGFCLPLQRSSCTGLPWMCFGPNPFKKKERMKENRISAIE